MPATEFALRLEQAYGRELGRLWRRVGLIVLAGYDRIDPERLAASFRAFVPAAVETIALGQQQAQALAVSFLTQYVEAEAQRAYRAAPAGDGIAGTAPDDAPLGLALSGAVGATWMALRQGRPAPEALGIGRLFVGRLAGRAVSDAAERELTHQASQSRGLLSGWAWVAVGDTCIACLAQADNVVRPYPIRMRKHAGCDCHAAPSIVGIEDRVARPTGEDLFRALRPEEQVAIFKSAGAEKAAMVRSGRASLRDFVELDPTVAGSVISEAPLGAVA